MPVSDRGGDGSTPGGGAGRASGSTAVIGQRILSHDHGSAPAGGMPRAPTASRDGQERKNPGDDLFSRKAALSVSSALEGLTSVFGMGTGVAPPLGSPGFVASGWSRQR